MKTNFIENPYRYISQNTTVGQKCLQKLLVDKIDGFFRRKLEEKSKLLDQKDISFFQKSKVHCIQGAYKISRVLIDTIAGVILITAVIFGVALELTYKKIMNSKVSITKNEKTKVTKDETKKVTVQVEKEEPQSLEKLRKFVIERIKKAETDNDRGLKSKYIQFLYVLEGIKPVLVCEQGPFKSCELPEEIEGITKASDRSGNFFYINEHPKKEFDPRRFIDPRYFVDEIGNPKSIKDMVVTTFVKQNHAKSDQLLSYLLGYGSSWPAFYLISLKRHKQKGSKLERYFSDFASDDKRRSVFSDEHFYQLGAAYAKIKGHVICDRGDFIEMGKRYSDTCVNDKTFYLPNITSSSEDPIDRRFINSCSYQVYDDVSYYTPYIQEMLSQREQLLIKYGINAVAS